MHQIIGLSFDGITGYVQRQRGRGGGGTNYRGLSFREGGPTTLHYVLVFLSSTIICRLHKLTLSDSVKTFSWSALARGGGGGGPKIFLN
jgi:hypothetical protein